MKRSVVVTSFFQAALCIVFATAAVNNSFGQELKPVYQINCGGPAVGSFAADAYFEDGKTYGTNTRVDVSGVPNAPPVQVYNTQRYGASSYTFPNLSPGAAYVVRLHFAETYFADPRPGRVESPAVGKRVFIVLINHKVVLEHFDILAIASPNHAVVKEFTVSADANGKIKVNFQSNIGSEAMINAIEILQGPGSSAGTSIPARPETPANASGNTSNGKATFNAQNPCDKDDARQKIGLWNRGIDDLATADPTLSKDQIASIHKKLDLANAILKRSMPDLAGVDVKAYHSVRGSPYVKNGPFPFGLTAAVFDYECVPITAANEYIRGTIVIGSETGTWLHVYFNSVAGLVPAGNARLVNGARIYLMPKVEGQVRGLPLLVPQRLDGWRDEEVIITSNGELPFKPVSREAYLLGRQKAAQDEVDKLTRSANSSPASIAQRQNELASLTNYLNGLTEQEKQMQAVIKDPNAFPGNRWTKVFVTEAEGGYALVTLSARDFEPASSRTAAKIISVIWTAGPQEPTQQKAVRQIRDDLDVDALRQLLDQ